MLQNLLSDSTFAIRLFHPLLKKPKADMMHSYVFRTVAGLVLMGTVASGWRDVPTLAAAQAESPAAGALAPLRASMSCSQTRCTASAFGGSGVYVDWEWSLAIEDFDGGGSWSTADPSPYCVDGLMLGPLATVTDSNGATASGSDWVYC